MLRASPAGSPGRSVVTAAGAAPASAVVELGVRPSVKMSLSVPPSVATAPMMTTAMSAASRPYSIAVAPDSSFQSAS